MNRRTALAGPLTLLGSLLLIVATGCGAAPPSLGTAAPTSSTSASASTSSTSIAPPSPTDITLPPTTPPATEAGNGPTTTVLTGTTLTAGDQEISLTFVGPMTTETWQGLRGLVNRAAADGDKVRAAVAKIGAGPNVRVKLSEVDRFSGLGFAAGANTSQPVAIATDSGGRQVLVYAFSITGDPSSTTIVGFDRETGHVGLVEGPLDISDSTQNITTVP